VLLAEDGRRLIRDILPALVNMTVAIENTNNIQFSANKY
jgi:hypothetical protein